MCDGERKKRSWPSEKDTSQYINMIKQRRDVQIWQGSNPHHTPAKIDFFFTKRSFHGKKPPKPCNLTFQDPETLPDLRSTNALRRSDKSVAFDKRGNFPIVFPHAKTHQLFILIIAKFSYGKLSKKYGNSRCKTGDLKRINFRVWHFDFIYCDRWNFNTAREDVADVFQFRYKDLLSGILKHGIRRICIINRFSFQWNISKDLTFGVVTACLCSGTLLNDVGRKKIILALSNCNNL